MDKRNYKRRRTSSSRNDSFLKVSAQQTQTPPTVLENPSPQIAHLASKPSLDASLLLSGKKKKRSRKRKYFTAQNTSCPDAPRQTTSQWIDECRTRSLIDTYTPAIEYPDFFSTLGSNHEIFKIMQRIQNSEILEIVNPAITDFAYGHPENAIEKLLAVIEKLHKEKRLLVEQMKESDVSVNDLEDLLNENNCSNSQHSPNTENLFDETSEKAENGLLTTPPEKDRNGIRELFMSPKSIDSVSTPPIIKTAFFPKVIGKAINPIGNIGNGNGNLLNSSDCIIQSSSDCVSPLTSHFNDQMDDELNNNTNTNTDDDEETRRKSLSHFLESEVFNVRKNENTQTDDLLLRKMMVLLKRSHHSVDESCRVISELLIPNT